MTEYFLSPSFKSHLENAYFISCILLLGTLAIGLWQLRLSLRISRSQSQREAFRIAAERCDYFGQVLLPAVMQLEAAFKASGVELLSKCAVTVGDKQIQIEPKNLNKADGEAANAHAGEITKLFNGVEGFAAFFVCRVADDGLGFLLCGRAFCSFFERFIPIYLMSGSLDNHAQATQKLYGRWSERIRRDELKKQQAEIKNRLDSTKCVRIKPLGTE